MAHMNHCIARLAKCLQRLRGLVCRGFHAVERHLPWGK